jgi:DNA-binding CsgD family transcriptional regulator/PAS domain-containing protein
MDEAEQLSALIGDIYDAAIDPERWPTALEKTCAFVVGVAGSLQSHDTSRRSANFYFTWNDDPEYTKTYIETYAGLNPAIVPTLIQTKVGNVSTFLDVVPVEQYRMTRLYTEWSAPQGYIDALLVTLEKSATAFAGVAIMRHERHGPADEAARQRMRLLAPHFQRAVTIGKVIDLQKMEAATLADTLDGLAASMVLVDAAARIVHANSAALAMLDEGSVIRAAGGKLTAADTQADHALHDIFINADAGDAAVGTKGIAVPLTARDGERHVAHVLPLTSGARRKAGIAYSAVAAVFVCRAALDLPHPVEALANAFKLTPAETRVLMMIVQVGGIPEVAPVLGVSETTVRTHLQSIFAKTGAGRQADLVKLVAGYMSPLTR